MPGYSVWTLRAAGLLSVAALATDHPEDFKLPIGVLMAIFLVIDVRALRQGKGVEHQYPDPASRRPLLTLDLLATLAALAVIVS